jgi:transmembrane sensor
MQGRNGETLEEEAANWFARMRGPEAAQHAGEFEAWLARGALHRAAYNRAGEIFALGKFLGAGDALSKASDNEPESGTARPERQRPAARWAIALTAALLVGAAAWMVLQHRVNPSRAGAHMPLATNVPTAGGLSLTTAAGQRLIQRLADGSVVTLEANSRLLVAFDSAHRDLQLVAGGARFEVAHESRPFVVRVAGGSVTARGTVFDVTVTQNLAVSVHLIRGSVDVVPPERRGAVPRNRRLAPGQSASFQGLAVAAPLADRPAHAGKQVQASSQENDLQTFNDAPVSDIVAQANRTGGPPIVLKAVGVEQRKVSGRFRISDHNSLASRLAVMFGLEIDISDPAMIALRPMQLEKK